MQGAFNIGELTTRVNLGRTLVGQLPPALVYFTPFDLHIGITPKGPDPGLGPGRNHPVEHPQRRYAQVVRVSVNHAAGHIDNDPHVIDDRRLAGDTEEQP